jgi:uncharacterized protein YjiS (DUF1127 family)
MKKLLSTAIELAQSIRSAIAQRRSQRRDRDAFMQLVWQEDRIFSDIGYTRADVNWAANLPIHMNAAKELQNRVRGGEETGCKETAEPEKPIERASRVRVGANSESVGCVGCCC